MVNDVRQEEYEALAGFRQTLRQFLDFSSQSAKQEGLSPRQHQALLAIRGAPVDEKVTIGALAQRLCSKPQTTSELVTRMEGEGLLRRRPGTVDARQVWLEITEAGSETLRRLSWAHREELRRLGPKLEQVLKRLDGYPSPEDSRPDTR